MARWRGCGAILLCVLLALAAAACSQENRRKVLVLLFEEVPASGDDATAVVVARRPRRPAPPTPPPTSTPAPTRGVDLAAFRTWEDALLRLPKSSSGGPDWSRALDEGIIAPLAGIDSDARAEEVLDLDVEMVAWSDPALSVVFSHRSHTEWLACGDCHPEPFAMAAGETPGGPAASHDAQHCGRCHGAVAFPIAGSCMLCHLQRLPKDESGQVDWMQALASHAIAPGGGPRPTSSGELVLDLDVEFPSAAQPDFRALFSHGSHTRWLACDNCHPRLFERRRTSLAGVELHSRDRCGACHGVVAFGQTEGCRRCHPAFEKARHHHNSLDLDVTAASGRVFSHDIHTPWVECASCHTDLYEAAPATEGTSAADFYSGRYCRQCHGEVADDLAARCQACHGAAEDQ